MSREVGTAHHEVLPPIVARLERLTVRCSHLLACSSTPSRYLNRAVAADGVHAHESRKMRLTSIFFRNTRQPQNEKKVPFKAMMPLSLKNYVTTKNRKAAERGCLYEVTLLLSCLEENEYEDKNCIPQLKTLNDCYERYDQNVMKQKIESKNRVPVPNSKSQSPGQLTYLLKRYPTV